ncbi:MAG TPA: VWA domain-containing protein, partial [Bryobacteraceae bacterium]
GRKSLIWVTGSFPLLVRTAHETKDFSQDMKEAARALNDANVALYAVDARGLIGTGLMAPGLDTMNDLAGHTGGKAFYADNGIDSLIKAAVEDSELIYTLGFYPSQESQNGDWHKLKVEVARRGVSVRYREAYFASNVLADADRHPTLNQLLHNTLDAAEIGLRAETAPDQARPGAFKLRAIVDLHDVHLEHQDSRWVGGVEVSLYLEGAPSAYKITRKIAIPDDQLAAALDMGIVVEVSVGLPGPAGDLRVVVQDNATGAGGSLRVPLGRM